MRDAPGRPAHIGNWSQVRPENANYLYYPPRSECTFSIVLWGLYPVKLISLSLCQASESSKATLVIITDQVLACAPQAARGLLWLSPLRFVTSYESGEGTFRPGGGGGC
jgi:hypothetical protein